MCERKEQTLHSFYLGDFGKFREKSQNEKIFLQKQ